MVILNLKYRWCIYAHSGYVCEEKCKQLSVCLLPLCKHEPRKKKESKQVKKVYELDRIIQIKIKVLKMFFALQEHGTPGIFIYNIN